MEKINNFDEKLCICGHTESEAHIFFGDGTSSQCIGNGGNCECTKFVEQTQAIYESALSLTERQRNAFRDELKRLGYTDDALREVVATEPDYDLRHEWDRAFGSDRHICKKCNAWTANLPLYKNDICPKKDRRKNERRQSK